MEGVRKLVMEKGHGRGQEIGHGRGHGRGQELSGWGDALPLQMSGVH